MTPTSGPDSPGAAGATGPTGTTGLTEATGPTGLRERARRAMRAEVAAVALTLFAERGFDDTTVEQIAHAAGMSRTSFFRYFPSKEDVVLGHLEGLGHQIARTLSARPPGEDPWNSLRAALIAAHDDRAPSPDQALRLGRMLLETPSLRARHLEKQQRWQDLFIPVIAHRLAVDPTDPSDPSPRALVAAALGCLDAAHRAWVAAGGTTSMRALINRTFDVLATRSPPRR